VGRRRHRRRIPLEDVADDGALPEAVGPGGVEVVARRVHAEGELDRPDSTLLAKDRIERDKVVGRFERKRVWVTTTGELVGGHATPVATFGHDSLLPRVAFAFCEYRDEDVEGLRSAPQ